MTRDAVPAPSRGRLSWLLGGCLALALHVAAGLLVYDVKIDMPGAQQQAAVTYELEPMVVEPEPAAPAPEPSPAPTPAGEAPAADKPVEATASEPAASPSPQATDNAPTPTAEETAVSMPGKLEGPPPALEAAPIAKPMPEQPAPVVRAPHDTTPEEALQPAEQFSVPLPQTLDGPPPSLRAAASTTEPLQPEPATEEATALPDGAAGDMPPEQFSIPLPETLQGPPPLLEAPARESAPAPKPPVPKAGPKAVKKEVRQVPPAPAREKAREPQPAKATKPQVAKIPRVSPRAKPSKTDEKAGTAGEARSAGNDVHPKPGDRGNAGRNSAPNSGGSAGMSAARWQAEVNAHIRRFRQYPAGATGSASIRVQFRINASGTVKSVSIAGSSGNPLLDRAAADTVRRASPVPAPPPDIARSTMNLAIIISFKR